MIGVTANMLFHNGDLLREGDDYTLSGCTLLVLPRVHTKDVTEVTSAGELMFTKIGESPLVPARANTSHANQVAHFPT